MRIFIIDASPFIFKGYFASSVNSRGETVTFRNQYLLKSETGRNLGAVQSFAELLLRCTEGLGATHLAVAFDGGLHGSFRNEIHPEYKQHRNVIPPAVEDQMLLCRELCERCRIRAFVDERYEADDLIGALALQLQSQVNGPITIMTVDKDLMQLVNEQVYVFDGSRSYGPTQVFEKLGVHPGQVSDYLALAGDTADGIPGGDGIGHKSAVSMLSQFQSLSGIYENLDKLKDLDVRGANTLGSKLASSEKNVMLSKKLARLATEAPVCVKQEDLRWKHCNIMDGLAYIAGD